jgi:DNA-binding beta-propeller fold protein YncE
MLIALLLAATALGALGGLTQKPGTSGCISNNGLGGTCTLGRVVVPKSVVVSGDGRNVYAAGVSGLAVFDRDPATGGLTQKAGTAGCLADSSNNPSGCYTARGLKLPGSVALSPDGATAYVTSSDLHGDFVAVLNRNPATGTLTEKAGTAGCVSEGGVDGCTVARAMSGARGVVVSPDGKSVYVVTYMDRVLMFDRDQATGGLIQKPGRFGCYSDDGTDGSGGPCTEGVAIQNPSAITVSPDGKSAYVASRDSDAVAIFTRKPGGLLVQKPGTAGCISRNGTGGSCVNGDGLGGADTVAVSPGGTSVYVASVDVGAVAIFDRNASGALTQKPGTAGCVSEDGNNGRCRDGHGLAQPLGMAISPGGANVYVASIGTSGVAILNRAGSGALTQAAGTAGCVSEDGSGGACADGHALNSPEAVAVSPDGNNVYVAAFNSGAVDIFDRAGGTKPPPGGGGGGGGATDTTPPDLKIDKKPKKKIETKHKKVEVKVKFSSEDGATFTCRLDKRDFKSCSSPYKAKLKAGKHKTKKHKIKIVATDAAGNESEATTVKVNVKRKRRGARPRSARPRSPRRRPHARLCGPPTSPVRSAPSCETV